MKTKSAFEIISESLDAYGGRQKSTDDHRMITCCFHDDNTPSLGIYVAEGMSIPLGAYHCFGCGASGSWNALADKCGFPKFKEWNTYKTETTKATVDEEYTLTELLKTMRSGSNPWPTNRRWRGFDGNLINDVGGILIDDSKTGGVSVFFPVYVGSYLRGGVKAAMKKEKHSLSYVTTKGNWVKKYGLFLFEQVKLLRKKYVIIVEGPRDALRLYEKGLPAIAILGSQNFGEGKALILSSLCPELVIVLPDKDDAGAKMKKLIKQYMSTYCRTISINLPDNVKDPMDMSDTDIKDFKRFIKSL